MLIKLAERKGFEPSIRFWRIHTFQACAFDHSATSLNPNHYMLGAQISQKKDVHQDSRSNFMDFNTDLMGQSKS